MSQENVEIVRRMYDMWNRGDFGAGMEFLDSKVVIDRSRSVGPEARIYRGLAEAEQFWVDWNNAWADARWEIDECIGSGDTVAVFGRLHARGVTSGVTVDANVSQTFELRGGKITRATLFQSRSDALEAAGLRD
jgi:ketosteroid isomerase-like protein